MSSAWVVVAFAALAAAGAARRGDADFEFDDDAAAGGARRPRTYVYDPHSAACRSLTCARRETCLQRAGGGAALCADKRALLRAGDVIVSASSAAAPPVDGAWGRDDDDVFYETAASAGAGAIAGAESHRARADGGGGSKPDRCVGCGGSAGGSGARAQFVCGSDNRTYSSLCRLDLHNCVRRARRPVAALCRGFCPCAPAAPARAAPAHPPRRPRRPDHEPKRDYEEYDDEWWRHARDRPAPRHASAHNEVLPHRDHPKRRLSKGAEGCELDKMADRLLDWFSVLMDEAGAAPPPPAGFPRECKPEVRWMFAHLDADGDGLLSAGNLYALRHDEREQCLRPFLASCGGAGRRLTRGAWCACLRRAARPCTALARAHPGAGAGAYVPACDARGYYVPRQCHPALGVCWCVSPHGAELPGSRTRGAPACPTAPVAAHDERNAAEAAVGGAPPADDEDADVEADADVRADAELEADAEAAGSGDAELRF